MILGRTSRTNADIGQRLMSAMGGKRTPQTVNNDSAGSHALEGGLMRNALLGLSALMLGLASPAPAAGSESARVDPWVTRTGGLERANQVIDQCFAHTDETPRQTRYSCVRAAYEACEDEHGTSQSDMNTCAAFSNAAWEARIASTISRFVSATGSETRLGDLAVEAKQEIVQSQRRWSEWNASDCELQTKGAEGGSIYPLSKSICLSDHAAVRAIDLQEIIEWWLG